MNSLHSFKRLSSTYVGAHLPKELRQRFGALWHNIPCGYEPGGWAWEFGSGFFQCELIVCDLDSEFETVGYLAIQPLSEQKPYWINCVLCDKKFDADAEVVRSKIFDSMSEAKAFLDSILAFPTPEIPAPV
jgi:hypothetical protein